MKERERGGRMRERKWGGGGGEKGSYPLLTTR